MPARARLLGTCRTLLCVAAVTAARTTAPAADDTALVADASGGMASSVRLGYRIEAAPGDVRGGQPARRAAGDGPPRPRQRA